ncbi:hypothetical protein E1295_48315, partial [Nonomuraea mesophila]
MTPSTPPWEPPPAFTAAAAGMPVWPGPTSDPHAMPPWPAATGELVAEPDPDEPGLHQPGPDERGPDERDSPAAAFDPNATDPEGFTRLGGFPSSATEHHGPSAPLPGSTGVPPHGTPADARSTDLTESRHPGTDQAAVPQPRTGRPGATPSGP